MKRKTASATTRRTASITTAAENADPETGTFGIQVAESLIVLLGGGKDNADEGFNKFMALRKRQVQEYLHRLEVAGMPERYDRMDPVMKMALEV